MPKYRYDLSKEPFYGPPAIFTMHSATPLIAGPTVTNALHGGGTKREITVNFNGPGGSSWIELPAAKAHEFTASIGGATIRRQHSTFFCDTTAAGILTWAIEYTP